MTYFDFDDLARAEPPRPRIAEDRLRQPYPRYLHHYSDRTLIWYPKGWLLLSTSCLRRLMVWFCPPGSAFGGLRCENGRDKLLSPGVFALISASKLAHCGVISLQLWAEQSPPRELRAWVCGLPVGRASCRSGLAQMCELHVGLVPSRVLLQQRQLLAHTALGSNLYQLPTGH